MKRRVITAKIGLDGIQDALEKHIDGKAIKFLVKP